MTIKRLGDGWLSSHESSGGQQLHERRSGAHHLNERSQQLRLMAEGDGDKYWGVETKIVKN